MSRRDDEWLTDIVASADAIASHLRRGSLDDDLVFDAVRVRLIEIGEAAKDIDAEILATEPDAPWRGVAGMRDHLAHRYFDTAHGKGTIGFATAAYKAGAWRAGQTVGVVCDGGLVHIHHRGAVVATHARRHPDDEQTAGVQRTDVNRSGLRRTERIRLYYTLVVWPNCSISTCSMPTSSFEIDDRVAHLFKHPYLGVDDIREVWQSDPLFYPAKPPAHWLMVSEIAGHVLVVPLAPPESGDPTRCRPIGCYEAVAELAARYREDR